MNVEIVKGLVSITTIVCICFTVIFCFKYYLQFHKSKDFDDIFDELTELKEEVSRQKTILIDIREGVKEIEKSQAD